MIGIERRQQLATIIDKLRGIHSELLEGDVVANVGNRAADIGRRKYIGSLPREHCEATRGTDADYLDVHLRPRFFTRTVVM
jgi:hypothetical protein